MNQETKNVLSIGTIVRLKTDHEEHRGKYFKILDILENTLIKVLWQDKIYYFYDTELEVVKPIDLTSIKKIL